MLPIFLYCARWGCKESFLASFAYGLLQLIFDGAYAWGPTSMLLDYVLAFGVLGVACLFRKQKGGVFVGTVVGCVCRFIVHFISGITIYRIYEPTEVFNTTFTLSLIHIPIAMRHTSSISFAFLRRHYPDQVRGTGTALRPDLSRLAPAPLGICLLYTSRCV